MAAELLVLGADRAPTGRRLRAGLSARVALLGVFGGSLGGCGMPEIIPGDFSSVTVRPSDVVPADRNNSDGSVPMDAADTSAVDAPTPDTADVTPPPMEVGADVPPTNDTPDVAVPPVDVPQDTGPSCTPTSVVVGNDNVVVAAHGNNVPVVINFNGECPTLGTGAVQARINSGGAPFPMFGVTMNTLEATRARGVMNLTIPELSGFPLTTFMARDGIENALTGSMFPASFTLPVNFVVDRTPPVMMSVNVVSFDRNAGSYNFSFMGDSDGKLIFDVRTVPGDAGPGRSLLTHGVRNACTFSRGTVPGRSVSTGCGSDSLGGPQSCVYLDGAYVCESDRLMFPITANIRASNTIQERDYRAIVDSTVARTPLSFVWTYQDNRGNTTQGTRSIMMLN